MTAAPGPRAPVPQVAGHRLRPHPAGCIVEAWGPDRASCLTEALGALVESFAEVADTPVTRSLPLTAVPPGARDEVVILFEEVIYALDVFGIVPLRFHLAETEDGGVAGEMDVVPADRASLVGPVPKGVSSHGLTMDHRQGAWRCHVLVEV